MSRKEEVAEDIPEKLYDATTGSTYRKLRFFGKVISISISFNLMDFCLTLKNYPFFIVQGGFAKCYEIQNVSNGDIYAGKIVSKKLMMKTNQKEKMTQEIQIHKSLQHRNIVGFHSFFDDPNNVYIVLELCKKRSMMELHKRRKVVTDYECRYYIHQIVSGVKYLHDHNIIHRDLKLGNLFLNDDLHVKVRSNNYLVD